MPLGITREEWYEYRERLLELKRVRELIEHREPLYQLDWVYTGEERFGEEASQALADCKTHFGWTENTYYTYTKIAREFPPERRLEGLGIRMYQEVMKAPYHMWDDLLRLAQAGKWTTSQMEKAVRDACLEEEKPRPVTKKMIESKARQLLKGLTPQGDYYAAYKPDVEELADLLGVVVPDLVIEAVDVVEGQEAINIPHPHREEN